MMQNKNVVMNKNCHSRTLLSGIYNACRCKMKKNTLLNRYVEDPRYQPSGMTLNLIPPLPTFGHPFPQGARKAVCGFTLIELLVVVLIIGILAAVAVPQYQKAVLKSQIASLLPLLKALHQAEETYYLANGKYTHISHKLDISVPEGFTPETGNPNGNLFIKGNFMLGLSEDDVYIMYCPGKSTFQGCLDTREFSLYYNHFHTEHPYAGKMGCIYWTNLGKYICNTTELNQYIIEKQHE